MVAKIPNCREAVLLTPMEDATRRAVDYVSLLGIRHNLLSSERLVFGAIPIGCNPRYCCLVLSGQDIATLVAAAKRRSIEPEQVIADFGSIVCHSIDPDSDQLTSLQVLLGTEAICVRRFRNPTYRISADHQAECGPLSGLTVTTEPGDKWGIEVQESRRHPEVWISIGGAGSLIRLSADSQNIFIASTTDIIDFQTPVAKNVDFGLCFSRVVPLLVSLRAIFGQQAWAPPTTFANITIDDPPLHRRYGRLDLVTLAEAVDRLRCAVTIGAIPWNHRRSDAQVARMFREGAPRLGICYHGCDHTSGEFGLNEVHSALLLLRLARERMSMHQSTTGIECQPLMIFPQGVFSDATMEAMAGDGWCGAVNTEIRDVSGAINLTVGDLLHPAVSNYHGIPLFVRRKASESSVNFAVDLFLGRPCLIVTHHDFFAGGLAAFEQLVHRISGLTTKVIWSDLRTISGETRLIRIQEDGRTAVMVFTNDTILGPDIPESAAVTKFCGSKLKDLPIRVEVNSVPVRFVTEQQAVRFDLDGSRASPAHIRFVRSADNPPTQHHDQTVLHKLHVAARRVACEYRDNHLSQSRFWKGCFRLGNFVLTGR